MTEELWDIYDVHKEVTGRTMRRDDKGLWEGEYHLAVLGVMMRPDGKFLITKRAQDKKWGPGWWEVPGGAVQAGENSDAAIRREILEETGLDISKASGGFLYDYHRENRKEGDNYFVDVYRFIMDFTEEDIHLQQEEAEGFQIVDYHAIQKYGEEGVFLHYESLQRAFHASDNANAGSSMGNMYFVRHGQTFWNAENKICGATDIALTEKGHAQAVQTGQKILDEGIVADEILYSPLIRAKDTALHISEITGIPAREEVRLKEQNFGRFEATARDGREFKLAKGQFASNYGNGESMLHLAQRIYNLLDELKQDEKTYILVAHNGIARMVQSYFYEMTNEEFAAFGVDNCTVIRYQW